jgi:hypothetical protein
MAVWGGGGTNDTLSNAIVNNGVQKIQQCPTSVGDLDASFANGIANEARFTDGKEDTLTSVDSECDM